MRRPPDPGRAAAPAGGTGAGGQSGWGPARRAEDTSADTLAARILDAVGAARPDIPAHLLDTPTIGAWRRANGITGWTVEGRHAFAVAVAEEAWRRAVIDRLDSIMRTVAAGVPTPEIVHLLAVLLDDIAPWLAQAVADTYAPSALGEAA
jgi:hypothetical protein